MYFLPVAISLPVNYKGFLNLFSNRINLWYITNLCAWSTNDGGSVRKDYEIAPRHVLGGSAGTDSCERVTCYLTSHPTLCITYPIREGHFNKHTEIQRTQHSTPTSSLPLCLIIPANCTVDEDLPCEFSVIFLSQSFDVILTFVDRATVLYQLLHVFCSTIIIKQWLCLC